MKYNIYYIKKYIFSSYFFKCFENVVESYKSFLNWTNKDFRVYITRVFSSFHLFLFYIVGYQTKTKRIGFVTKIGLHELFGRIEGQ